MAAKAILVLCAQALLIQSALSQCIGPAAVDATRYGAPFGLAGRGLAYDGLTPFGLAGRGRGYDGLGLGCGSSIIDITATSGGGLPVTSTSAIPPVGLSITSENVYEGILAAAGELPFVGTAGVEGELPTAGAGAINYGCGNGITAMVSETTPAAAAFSPAAAIGAPAIGAFGPAIGAVGPAAIAAPALGYSAGWVGSGCGCGY